MSITFKLEEIMYKKDLHIFSEVSGALISWNASKNLEILCPTWPYSENQFVNTEKQSNQELSHKEVQMTQASCNNIAENLVKQFPVVFNDNIYTMEGEKFHIYFADDAVYHSM